MGRNKRSLWASGLGDQGKSFQCGAGFGVVESLGFHRKCSVVEAGRLGWASVKTSVARSLMHFARPEYFSFLLMIKNNIQL
jgi:hypothetical protein